MGALAGRYIHLAGSASQGSDRVVLSRCHAFVRELVRGVVSAGGGLLIGIGADERLDADDADSALLFDWTVVDEIERVESRGLGALVIASQKDLERIPLYRQARWKVLVDAGALSVRSKSPSWNAGAYLREYQAATGHGLVILGGGEGVEHLASLYMRRGHMVVPLDADLPSNRGDGSGGSRRLYRLALAKPERFVFRGGQRFGDLLSVTSLMKNATPAEVAMQVVAILEQFVTPRVFCARLTNKGMEHTGEVDRFLEAIVGPSLLELGFEMIDVTQTTLMSPFINTEIFDQLRHADAVVADLTGARPNVYVEAGYGFGREIPVILTALDGTVPEFNVQAVPIFLWNPSELVPECRRRFIDHWRRVSGRGPLATPRDLE